jgi:hypothetical protein
MDAGLPDGAIRPRPKGPFEAARVREAVREAASAPADVAPLLAWLRAWQQHWGSHFRRTLGDEGDQIVKRLRASLDDENRYLKLRRIAIENLSAML